MASPPVPKNLTLEKPGDEILSWLDRCAVGELRNTDVLNDLNHSLKEEGFSCCAKYVGGFRYLLECDSKVDLLQMLTEGKEKLDSWFSWLRPWEIAMEMSRPGRLVWISIEGIPLHAWTESTFQRIAKEFGEIMEVEELTLQRVQTHLARVCISTSSYSSIDKVVSITMKDEVFTVRVLEDMAEIIDFGPRYELEESDESAEQAATGSYVSDSPQRIFEE